MPEFRLIKKGFSMIDQEWQWTYACLFTLIINHRKIAKITITDHTWRKKGREKITKEMILAVLKEKLNGKTIKPTNYPHRQVFKRERIPYQHKKYKIVFWFEIMTRTEFELGIFTFKIKSLASPLLALYRKNLQKQVKSYDRKSKFTRLCRKTRSSCLRNRQKSR